MARGFIIISKTKSESRMKENLGARSLVLDSADMTQLRGLDRNLRYLSGDFMLRAEENTDDLWDVEEDKTFNLGCQ